MSISGFVYLAKKRSLRYKIGISYVPLRKWRLTEIGCEKLLITSFFCSLNPLGLHQALYAYYIEYLIGDEFRLSENMASNFFSVALDLDEDKQFSAMIKDGICGDRSF